MEPDLLIQIIRDSLCTEQTYQLIRADSLMFRDLESQLLDCWLLEISHGLGIYIMEIDKRYKIELLNFFSESR